MHAMGVLAHESGSPARKKKVNRRRLFNLAGLSLAGLALPFIWSKPLRADGLFETLFGDAGLAAKVGHAHRHADPLAVERGRALAAELTAKPVSAAMRHLRQQAQSDLERLDVVIADGWVMARSEADFCAAVHQNRDEA